MPKLADEALHIALASLPAWQLDEGRLIRDFTFPGFPEAMLFVNQVAAIAEAANHHPDIDIRYNQVRLALISHDTGGLTNRDIKFAIRLDRDIPAPPQS